MSMMISWTILGGVVAILITISLYHPAWLDDRNSFLQEYIGQGFLTTLGIIVSITFASIINLNLQLNALAEKLDREFSKVQLELKQAPYALIMSFALALIITIIKPLVPVDVVISVFNFLIVLNYQALLNSGAIMILILSLLILLDIVGATFHIHLVDSAMRYSHKKKNDSDAFTGKHKIKSEESSK